MLRMGLAPCSPFTVDNSLMIAAAKLARQYEGVRLHTHLAENQVGLAATFGPSFLCGFPIVTVPFPFRSVPSRI